MCVRLPRWLLGVLWRTWNDESSNISQGNIAKQWCTIALTRKYPKKEGKANLRGQFK
jgi:hypothetical protein